MQRSSLTSWALALALTVVAAPRFATATTVVPVTVEDLARRADVVVLATVRGTHARWEGRLIVTDVELEVRVAMKGALASGNVIVLRVPGGVVGEVGQTIPGVARPERGDTFVAFLTAAEDRVPGRFHLTHLTASILPVVAASPSATSPAGAVRVRPAGEGMTLGPLAGATRSAPSILGTSTRTTAGPATAMTREGMSLEQLFALVRGAR
jgi:hypothetical protein